MKTSQERKALTLGELIEGGYRACGKRQAKAIIRLAAKARPQLNKQLDEVKNAAESTWDSVKNGFNKHVSG